jgi:predicted nucleic acid-binding protein
MIVVSDTSPLNYLIQIDHVEVLHKLYEQVLLPQEVREELLAHPAPCKVRDWAIHPPIWLQIRSASSAGIPGLDKLDAGERAAIALAVETHADRILIDERKARLIAEDRFNLNVTGTLSVLVEAHRAGFLNAYEAFDRLLRTTNFYCSPQLEDRFRAALSKPL